MVETMKSDSFTKICSDKCKDLINLIDSRIDEVDHQRKNARRVLDDFEYRMMSRKNNHFWRKMFSCYIKKEKARYCFCDDMIYDLYAYYIAYLKGHITSLDNLRNAIRNSLILGGEYYLGDQDSYLIFSDIRKFKPTRPTD